MELAETPLEARATTALCAELKIYRLRFKHRRVSRILLFTAWAASEVQRIQLSGSEFLKPPRLAMEGAT
jgi:hypothetical protein